MKQINSKKTKLVLVLFDVPFKIGPDFDAEQCLKLKDWKDERDVVRALRSLGYSVKLMAVYDNISNMIEKINKINPDTIFVLTECFKNNRDLAPNIVATLDLMNLRYTGPDPQSQILCKDKALSKKLLQFEGIKTPQFVVAKTGQIPRDIGKFNFPVITKPLSLEGSEGISQSSINRNVEDCVKRIKFIHKRFQCDVIIEEFIPGRELYCGVVGNNEDIDVFPPVELIYRKNNPKNIASFKAKWDEKYRKRKGIKTVAANLDSKQTKHVQDFCRKVYTTLQICSYARIDLRLTKEVIAYFIEANPSPSIAKLDDFAKSAKLASIDYEQLIEEIVELAS